MQGQKLIVADSARFVILVSTMGFFGMSDIVVLPEHTLGHSNVGKIQDGRHMVKVKQ